MLKKCCWHFATIDKKIIFDAHKNIIKLFCAVVSATNNDKHNSFNKHAAKSYFSCLLKRPDNKSKIADRTNRGEQKDANKVHVVEEINESHQSSQMPKKNALVSTTQQRAPTKNVVKINKIQRKENSQKSEPAKKRNPEKRAQIENPSKIDKPQQRAHVTSPDKMGKSQQAEPPKAVEPQQHAQLPDPISTNKSARSEEKLNNIEDNIKNTPKRIGKPQQREQVSNPVKMAKSQQTEPKDSAKVSKPQQRAQLPVPIANNKPTRSQRAQVAKPVVISTEPVKKGTKR